MLQKRAQKIDELIGRNIRIHRLAKRMSQIELGDQLGISYQQVQKYENGTNRVGGAVRKVVGIRSGVTSEEVKLSDQAARSIG
jgi:transcriptional regulator with XRE-family HTH domain